MKKHRVSLSTKIVNETELSNEERSVIEQEWQANLPTQESVIDSQARIELEVSDKEMARVTEDLIDLLLNKGIITSAELPADALEIITTRKSLRDKLI